MANILTSGSEYLGTEVMAPAVTAALADPATQREIERTIARALSSPDTRAALRPYLVEAGLSLAAALVVGALFFTWLRR